jgi:DNA polymerase III alpha subunit
MGSGAIKFANQAEWTPEDLAAYDLAQGFLTASPLEVQKRADRLVQEFGVTGIAELVDYPDKAPASVRAISTKLRLRTTRKGERMAWLTLADATGDIEAAVPAHWRVEPRRGSTAAEDRGGGRVHRRHSGSGPTRAKCGRCRHG